MFVWDFYKISWKEKRKCNCHWDMFSQQLLVSGRSWVRAHFRFFLDSYNMWTTALNHFRSKVSFPCWPPWVVVLYFEDLPDMKLQSYLKLHFVKIHPKEDPIPSFPKSQLAETIIQVLTCHLQYFMLCYVLEFTWWFFFSILQYRNHLFIYVPFISIQLAMEYSV